MVLASPLRTKGEQSLGAAVEQPWSSHLSVDPMGAYDHAQVHKLPSFCRCLPLPSAQLECFHGLQCRWLTCVPVVWCLALVPAVPCSLEGSLPGVCFPLSGDGGVPPVVSMWKEGGLSQGCSCFPREHRSQVASGICTFPHLSRQLSSLSKIA